MLLMDQIERFQVLNNAVSHFLKDFFQKYLKFKKVFEHLVREAYKVISAKMFLETVSLLPV